MMHADPTEQPTAYAPPTASRELVPVGLPANEGVTPDEWAEDQAMIRRIEQLPREVGWLLIYVGLLGFILPGVIGSPFVIAGAAVVSPGGPKRLARWVGRKPHRLVHLGMKQITRLVDDLDRRYPLRPKTEA